MKLNLKNLSNIILGVIILMLLIPQTGKPVRVFVNRLFAFSPMITDSSERKQLKDYNWILRNSKGELLNLSEAKGKPLIINLWATWCPPCIAEIPSLEALYANYNTQINFYFISMENEDVIRSFLHKKNINISWYSPLSPAPELIKSTTLPTTYLIDQAGNIIIEKKGTANWNSTKVRESLEAIL